MITSDEIAAALRARIDAGLRPPDDRPDDALEPGAQLETHDQLAGRYGANRNTAARAVTQLASEGLVYTGRGQRTVVANARPFLVVRQDAYTRANRSAGGTTVEQQARAAGYEARTVHRYAMDRAMPDYVRELSGWNDGDVIHLSGECHVTPPGPDGPAHTLAFVVLVYDTWVRASVAPDAPHLLRPRPETPSDAPEWEGSVYSSVERATGLPMAWQGRRIGGRAMTGDEVVRFEADRRGPVHVADMTAQDPNRKVWIVARNVSLLGSTVWESTEPLDSTL